MRILVFGTFDHLHKGHCFLLSKAQEKGDLFVVVACDKTVKRLKGFWSDQDQKERMLAIERVYPAAVIQSGDSQDYLAPVRMIQPDLIVLGYDQQLPPGITEEDFPCPTFRVEAHEPQKYKSSFLRGGA